MDPNPTSFPQFENWTLQGAMGGTKSCDDGDPLAYLDTDIIGDGTSLPNYSTYDWSIDGSCA